MRLVSFRGAAGEVRSGVLDGDLVIDLAAAAPLALADADDLRWDMIDMLRGDVEGVNLAAAAEILEAVHDSFSMAGLTAEEFAYGAAFSAGGHALVQPIAQVSLLPPLPLPASLREYQPDAARRPIGALPPFRYANHLALLGAQQAIFAPEAGLCAAPALALVIGRGGRNIARDEAHEHIAGMMLLNCWQRIPAVPRRPRDLPTSCGPWLTTLDELEMYLDDDGLFSLELLLAVNERLRVRVNAQASGLAPADLVADVSSDVELLPGEVICWPLLPEVDVESDAALRVGYGDRVTIRATGLGTIDAALD